METILLRKMTMKSCFNEGKYANIPIGQIIQLNHQRWLRWCYYHLSNIDYMPDVKEAIKITAEFEIKKPGTSPEMNDKLNELIYSKTSTKARFCIAQKKKSAANRTWNNTLDRTPKSVLQARNHGKF